MSLPPGFLDELRTRITLSDVVGRKVVWDRRKSNAAKGDWWAPCPFHQEKTPSFHVDDRKGFYYCFGCRNKGDAIAFLEETENLSFVEAVERLSAEAGMEMPRRDGPRAREARDRHARLYEVMEQAVRLFAVALRSGAGAPARDYLADRGLDDESVRRFELGYAPEARAHQTVLFREKGLLEEAVAAGLVIRPEDGGGAYDRFRNRLMFPIRDARGRCIAFGGRALSSEARAKYLNSPETPVFSKGRTLYNHGPAREAAARNRELIVAEGYMDVIALARAGLDHAVAPLGTAVTAEQLQLLWRIADEPVIALDGDEAGLRAGNRLVDLALPLLAPGKSLRFCVLPEGQDPDDLIRTGGAEAMRRALAESRPLIQQLWLRETAGPLDTPERRAALDQRLRAALGTIADASVRNHYAAEIRARRADLFRPKAPRATFAQGRSGAGRPWANRPWANRPWAKMWGRSGFGRSTAVESDTPRGPDGVSRNSALVRSHGEHRMAARRREGAILATACLDPAACGSVELLLEEMTVGTPVLARVRDAILAALAEEDSGLAGERDETISFASRVAVHLGADPFEVLRHVPGAPTGPLVGPGRSPEHVAAILTEALRRHAASLAWESELSETLRTFQEVDGEEWWTARLAQAGAATQEVDAQFARHGVGEGESGDYKGKFGFSLRDLQALHLKKP